MSTKIAIVCEDFTHDQFIVGPVVEAVLAALGRPKARIQVVMDPRCRGFDDMLEQSCAILARYSSIAQVVIFVADTDCEDGDEGRPDKRLRLSNALARCDAGVDRFIAVGAVQEIEVWALWGSREKIGAPWADIRKDCDPKEHFFRPLLTQADRQRVDGGRSRLIASSLASGIGSLEQGCPEVSNLRVAISNMLSA